MDHLMTKSDTVRVPAGTRETIVGARAEITGDLTTITDDELSAALGTHAAHLAVAECHFCLMAAEVDRRGFWAGQGARSCAHWLSWRCGTSPLAAREHLRVGKALANLPLVREAFSSGTLSYSKVRALTRIATPELEATLVDMAAYATASQLETIVRAFRNASEDEGVEALTRHRHRSVHSYVDDEGMVVIQARLSPEDGATVLAAIEATRQSLSKDEEEEPRPGVPAETSGTRPALADTTSTPATTHNAPFEGTFAASQADALVAICEAAIAKGVLLPTAYGPHASVVVHVDTPVLSDASAEGCSHIDGVGLVSAHTVQRLACDAAVSSLAFRPQGSVVPEGKTREVPHSLRRAVLARDSGCRFPGCGRWRYVDVHHVLWVSKGGKTRLTNLVSLCRFHHRLVHEGGYALSMDRNCVVGVVAPDGRGLPIRSILPGSVPGALERDHDAAGLHIDDTTMTLGGERFSLDLTVDVLLTAAVPV